VSAAKRWTLLVFAWGLRGLWWLYAGTVLALLGFGFVEGFRTGSAPELVGSHLFWMLAFAMYIVRGWSRDLFALARRPPQ
jgi:hypothetical protein